MRKSRDLYHTLINKAMEKTKDFSEWRAKQLGYVYLSRLKDLVIKESDTNDSFFDFLVDIGENQRQTGRLFGVEVRAQNGTPIDIQSIVKQYQNIAFPLLILAIDNKTDQGYFAWIKEPKKDGRMLMNHSTESLNKLENDSLNKIVRQVKDWYVHQSIVL
jgi:hypothetical protein